MSAPEWAMPGREDCAEQFTQFTAAARVLRDAELALRKAQAGYRQALEALNRAVAPMPDEPANR